MNSKEKILFLDDSRIICALVTKMLNEGGYEKITVVSTIEDAKASIDREKYDIALLDYNIEGVTSDSLLDYIKDKYPEIIVIVLSGQVDRGVVVKLMRKADDYIVKDESSAMKDELFLSINNCINVRDLKKQNIELMNSIKERNDELKRQLVNAQILLKDIFPKNMNPSKSFNIKVMHRPWDVIGGDFYHIDKLDENKTGIFIADIAGHGIQSALLLFTLSNAYREIINGKISAKETIKNLNSQILRQFPESLFVTCCYLILDEENKKISICSAFENPLLVLKNNCDIIEITNGKIGMIGIDMSFLNNAEDDVFEEITLEFGVNEKIFMFTDGLVEVRNENKEPFGKERLKKIIKDNSDKSLEIIIKTIFQAVTVYSSNVINDDITLIGIERKI